MRQGETSTLKQVLLPSARGDIKQPHILLKMEPSSVIHHEISDDSGDVNIVNNNTEDVAILSKCLLYQGW